jgi:murein DD-endopeptidase MepM/ murein hydrolase activator NlpD
MSFRPKNKISKAKLKAKHNRHQRALKHANYFTQKQINKRPNQQPALSNLAKDSSEKQFALKVNAIAISFFVLFSLLPSFTNNNFLQSAQADFEAVDYYPTTSQSLDSGFTMSPAISTESGDRARLTTTIEVTLKAGETLSDIANKYGVSIKTLKDTNDIANPNVIKAGTKLTIIPVDGLLYQVKEKDTLAKIAKANKIEKVEIIKQNNLKSETIQVGQKLILPGAKKPEPPKYRSSGSTRITSSNPYGQAPSSYRASGSGKLLKPCLGTYTQYYRPGHYAVDIAKGSGTPIWAAEGGRVVKAQGGWNGGYGNMVIIDHGGGMRTLYAHLKTIYVQVGQTVSRGEQIGYMGNTGRVFGRTGIHLHFEVRVNGSKHNPRAYFW